MVKKELISRSPIRILEESTHGGLGRGNIGIMAGYKGVGKTACLVHMATDQLFQDKHVIHVSFKNSPNHIIDWYEDIFNELSKINNLDGAMDVHDSIIKNRIIMNFEQDGVHWHKIQERIRGLMDSSNFNAELVVVDGFDFSIATTEELNELKEFAQETGLEIWFTASLSEKPQGAEKVPEDLKKISNHVAIIIVLIHYETFIHLQLLKDHDNERVSDMHLKLDPETLLIAQE